MSYSFNVRGATKSEVQEKLAAEFDKVVASQPIHSKDRSAAEQAAQEFLAVLPNDADGKEFSLSVSGSVGWMGTLGAQAEVVISAGVNVSAALV